jgi:transcriptional regulator with XRE-family HTH domain
VDVRTYERFSDVIRAVRKEKGLSQREMARALSVSAGYVGQWELGLSKPSADVVRRICKTFELNEVEYVLRLAFAESAPDFLRESIVRFPQNGGPDTQTPVEQKVLSQVRRLGPQQQEQLLAKIEGWVEAVQKQNAN